MSSKIEKKTFDLESFRFQEDEVETRVVLNFIKENMNSSWHESCKTFVAKILKKEGAIQTQLDAELRRGEGGALWEAIHTKVQNCQRKIIPILSQGLQPTWLTGSKSAALIGIDEVAKTALVQGRHALVPTGVLLNHMIVPLAGELSTGVSSPQGINVDSLSGVVLENAGTAWEYAIKKQFVFIKQHATENLLNYRGNSLNLLKILTLRYLKTREREDPELQNIKEHLENRIKPQLPLAQLGEFELILKMFDEVQPLNLAEADRENLESYFPIIWGARIANEQFKRVRSDIAGEKVIQKPLPLGEEEGVTTAFVKKRDLPRIRQWLEERQLRVVPLSVGALYYLSLREAVMQRDDFSPFDVAIQKASQMKEYSSRIYADRFTEEERLMLAMTAMKAFPYEFVDNIRKYKLNKEQLHEAGKELYAQLPGYFFEHYDKFSLEDLKTEFQEFDAQYQKLMQHPRSVMVEKRSGSYYEDFKEMAAFLSRYPGAGRSLYSRALGSLYLLLLNEPERREEVESLVNSLDRRVIFPKAPTVEAVRSKEGKYVS